MSNLEAHYHFKLHFQKWTIIQEASGQSTAPDIARTISSKAWNSLIEYHSKESTYDIKELEGNMLNPIFRENVKEQKHTEYYIFSRI